MPRRWSGGIDTGTIRERTGSDGSLWPNFRSQQNFVMHPDRSVPHRRLRVSGPGLRKSVNREHWGIRRVRAVLGRTTYSALLLEADSVPIGTTAVPCRDATAEGVSTNEPHESADLPENLRGSRP